jgi:hypothetical protein
VQPSQAHCVRVATYAFTCLCEHEAHTHAGVLPNARMHTHTHTPIEIRRRDSSQTLESPSDFHQLQSRVLRAQCTSHTRSPANVFRCLDESANAPRSCLQHPRTTLFDISSVFRFCPSRWLSISGFEFGRRDQTRKESRWGRRGHPDASSDDRQRFTLPAMIINRDLPFLVSTTRNSNRAIRDRKRSRSRSFRETTRDGREHC